MRIKISNVQTIELPDDVDIEDAAQLFQNPTVVQSYCGSRAGVNARIAAT